MQQLQTNIYKKQILGLSKSLSVSSVMRKEKRDGQLEKLAKYVIESNAKLNKPTIVLPNNTHDTPQNNIKQQLNKLKQRLSKIQFFESASSLCTHLKKDIKATKQLLIKNN